MRVRATAQLYLALSFPLISNALPSSLNSSVSQSLAVPNNSSLASISTPQSSSVVTASKASSLSFNVNDWTTASSAPFSVSHIVSSSSIYLPQGTSSGVGAASSASSNSTGFATFHVNQKEINVPGITAAASYSTSGPVNSAIPTSITSMRKPVNVTKPVNQTSVCGGPVSVASSLITSGIFSANDCLPLNWDQGVLDLPLGGNCSMSPGFDGYNAKSCSCVNSAAKWYHDYATATVTSQQCQSSYDLYEATNIQSLGCSYNTNTELATPYPAPTGCCDKCEVAASAVQLVFWPPADAPSNSSSGTNSTGSNAWNVTAAPVQSAATYGIVENGYTFVSPSVYVIYSSIQASASCVALFNSHIPIGSAYTAVTRAYEPNVLSTAICEAENVGAGLEYCISPVSDADNPAYCFQGIDNGWRQIDFSELYDPPPASDLLPRYQSCFPGHSISADFASMMFVKPQLAFPPDVTDIDPVWATWGSKTCTPVNLGVYDPPRVLQKATALAPVPTPAADPQAESIPPSPAATLKSPVAAPTKAVTSADPNNGAEANDPGSNSGETVTPTATQSDPEAAIVGSVDYSAVAQNQGSNPTSISGPVAVIVDPANGSNSDPVTSGGNNTPVDTEKQSGANAATGSGTLSGTDSGIANNDPSTAAITLLPQQPADTVKGNSGTSGTNGQIGVTNNGNKDDSNGGTTGDTRGGTSNDTNGGTSDVTNSGVNGGSTAGNNGGSNGGTSGGTDGGSNGGTEDGASGNVNANSNANPAPVASVNSQPITKDSSGNLVLSGSTIAPGSTGVFSGHTIANVPSAVVMDGSSYAPSPTEPSTSSPLLVNNQLLQMTNGGLEIGSQTLAPGASTTVKNHVINYANPSQVIEDGVTHNLAPISSSNPLVLSGQTLSRAANGGLITAGTTIAPGSTAAISGHVYSLAGSASVIMGGSTYALPAATNAYQIQAPTPSPPSTLPSGPLTLSNGLVITAQPPTSPNTPQPYILPNGASLSPGGTPAVYAGTTYTALPSNAGIIAAGPAGPPTTLALPTLALPTIVPPTPPIYTAAGLAFTPEPSGFALGTTILTPGGPALTTSGTLISLGTSGTLIVGAHTYTLSPPSPLLPLQSIFTLDDGLVFTASPTGFEIQGVSVVPGGKGVVEGGEVVRLGEGGVLRIGGKTVMLAAAGGGRLTAAGSGTGVVGGSSPTTTGSVGAIIASGLGGGGSGVFGGGADAKGGRVWGMGLALGVGIGIGAVVL